VYSFTDATRDPNRRYEYRLRVANALGRQNRTFNAITA
jgi:hypothetical protein